jgi:hypothetical protein
MEESRKLLAAASPVASGDSEPAGLGSWQPGASAIKLFSSSLTWGEETKLEWST